MSSLSRDNTLCVGIENYRHTTLSSELELLTHELRGTKLVPPSTRYQADCKWSSLIKLLFSLPDDFFNLVLIGDLPLGALLVIGWCAP